MIARPLALAALLLISTPAFAEDAPAPAMPAVPLAGNTAASSQATSPGLDTAEAKAIISTLERLTAAANDGDLSVMADDVTTDFAVLTLDGQRIDGLDSFGIFWKSLTSDATKQPVKLEKIVVKPNPDTMRVTRLSPDVVLVEGMSEDSYTLPGAAEPILVPTHVTATFVKQAEDWKLARLAANTSTVDNGFIRHMASANSRAALGAALAGMLLGFLLGRVTSRRLYNSAEVVDKNPPKPQASAAEAPVATKNEEDGA